MKKFRYNFNPREDSTRGLIALILNLRNYLTLTIFFFEGDEKEYTLLDRIEDNYISIKEELDK